MIITQEDSFSEGGKHLDPVPHCIIPCDKHVLFPYWKSVGEDAVLTLLPHQADRCKMIIAVQTTIASIIQLCDILFPF